MGCDIKIHVEVKRHGKDDWLHWNKPPVRADYELFTKMANVFRDGREIVTPISNPKGIPDDATETVKFHYDYDSDDAHSESWLNAEEIAELRKWYDKRPGRNHSDFDREFGFLMGNQFDMFEFPEDFEALLMDVRFVFWFMG